VELQCPSTNSASRITTKFKLLRAALKKWSKGLSNLSNLIKYCNTVLETLDALEEQRPLFLQEFNFRKILKEHILRLLRYQKEYWKKRYTIRWTKFGDEKVFFMQQLQKGTGLTPSPLLKQVME
jgi:hypothetical protein